DVFLIGKFDAADDVDVPHRVLSPLRRLSSLPARLRPSGYAGHHASSFGQLVAAPRVARRAKRGGARRDRTADLLHAMQALSQLSYGPLSQICVPWATRRAEPRKPQFGVYLKYLRRC